jgi:Tfp pilus assembly protein PilF
VSLCDVRLFYDYDAAGAESACKRGLELDPNSADAHLTYSTLLNSRRRIDEALAEIKIAMDLAPASFRIQRQYANNLYAARRYAEAEEQYKRLSNFNP